MHYRIFTILILIMFVFLSACQGLPVPVGPPGPQGEKDIQGPPNTSLTKEELKKLITEIIKDMESAKTPSPPAILTEDEVRVMVLNHLVREGRVQSCKGGIEIRNWDTRYIGSNEWLVLHVTFDGCTIPGMESPMTVGFGSWRIRERTGEILPYGH